MAKWLLHSYLRVALNVHSARTPSQDLLKLLVRLGNSEIMFSFVEGKTVWRIIGESLENHWRISRRCLTFQRRKYSKD